MPILIQNAVVCLKSGPQKFRTFAFLPNRACPIRTYDFADMELLKITGAEAHFLYFLTLMNGIFKRSVYQIQMTPSFR